MVGHRLQHDPLPERERNLHARRDVRRSYGTYNGVYYQDYLATLQQLLADQQFYAENEIPEGMRWCRYDNFWYPQYYRDRYENDYDVNHYNYWFRQRCPPPRRQKTVHL